MRPVASRQGFLRAPLNLILGAEANIRVLRVLLRSGDACSASALAKSSGLSHSGTAKVIDGLVELGIVESLGSGRTRLFQMRRSHPLFDALKALFVAEASWATIIEESLKEIFLQLETPPLSAWIEGSVATDEDVPGDVACLCVLSPVKEQRRLEESLGSSIGQIEKNCDIPIDLVFLTEADLESLFDESPERFKTIKLLYGPPPSAFQLSNQPSRKRRGPMSHENVDKRHLQLGHHLAEALEKDPSIVSKALDFVQKRIKRASESEIRTLREWERILANRSLANLTRLLRDPGERATRLRQSLPFMGILTDDLRRELLETTKSNEGPVHKKK